MTRRVAKRGKNAGSQFWGCRSYPLCKGIRQIGEEGDTGETTVPSQAGAVPVTWTEGTPRARFDYEYVSIGSIPGVLRDQLGEDCTIKDLLSQTLLLIAKGRDRGGATDHARLASGLLAKLLQRGYAPLPTLGIEQVGLQSHGLIDDAEDLAEGGVEVGWRLNPEKATQDYCEQVKAELVRREPFAIAGESRSLLLQSDAEVEFITKWVPCNLGPTAGHWFTPQAPLDTLLEAASNEGSGGSRRIDFLVNHPDVPKFAIEIDGPEHLASQATDRERDKQLHAIGIEVIRLSNDEVFAGSSEQLDEIRRRFDPVNETQRASRQGVGGVAIDCSIASKVQYVITRAIQLGWLKDPEWCINLSGAREAGAAGVLDALQLLQCFDVLYGGRSVPERCTVRNDGAALTWSLVEGKWIEEDGPEAEGDRISIRVEREASPFHESDANIAPDFIIRPAYLPVKLAVEQYFDNVRRPIAENSYEIAQSALTTLLRTIFRKHHFRQQQGEAVFNTLRQNDSVVLLPTGAGKSIIYQMAGILMPGVTIVVDPIIALIEDQIEGLQSHGIDRAVGIVSTIGGQQERQRLLRQIEGGEYQFILHSPERLQSAQFRDTLRALREISLINLAVIDEAHCVSEWGHDFRPSYLNLANNLRSFAVDKVGAPPPLLALTGTASRAVLRDMLIDLGIDRSDSNALVRPESFDRVELQFHILRAKTAQEAQATLRGVLRLMPNQFRIGRGQFFSPNGWGTASGIVFTRTVNSRTTGLTATLQEVQRSTGAQTAIYSGGPPRGYDSARWDQQKRENAGKFKRNEAPVLVATKAFGMGIDKPNIRYIIHFGMAGSLESYYQEAGRAGRDQKPAHCVIVFTEFDEERSDDLLNSNIKLPELKRRFEAANRDRSLDDDITSAVYFHLQSFAGIEHEYQVIKDALERIGVLDSRKRCEITYDRDEDKRDKEHAIVRLLRLGVINDYEVDFGSKRLVVYSSPFDFVHCREKLRSYVQASQPHRSKVFSEELDAIQSGDSPESAQKLAWLLIAFIYDVIEQSRRNAIRESARLARTANSDAEIRKRLMDYLQEGLGAEQIDRLLDEQDVRLGQWNDLVEQLQTPLDAGELRGLCIRALEDKSPDHPGLRLARAVAEAMCSDGNANTVKQESRAAVESCIKNRIAEEDIRDSIARLYTLAGVVDRAGQLGLPLSMALLDLSEVDTKFAFCGELARELAPGVPDGATVLATYGFREGVQTAKKLTERIVQRREGCKDELE